MIGYTAVFEETERSVVEGEGVGAGKEDIFAFILNYMTFSNPR